MAQINFNTSFPNDGLGDKLRDAFLKQQAMNTELYNNKVDKVAGKDLSENNYSNADKAKVDALTGEEQKNVQADWNELDPTSDAFIIGKPIFSTSEIIVSAIWTGTGLNFDVSADSFPINGVSYPATPAVVTLDVADPTLDRIDLIVAIKPADPLTVGTVGKITGTPASTALVVPPDYDPSIYYVIKQITVKAAATTPDGAANTLIYDEGTEWTVSLSSNVAETANDPNIGAVSIEATNAFAYDFAKFTSPILLSTSEIDFLTFDLKLKQAISNVWIGIKLYNGSKLVKHYQFSAPNNNYDDLNLSYQTIKISKANLNIDVTDFDSISFQLYTIGGWFLDNFRMYTGSGSEVVPNMGIPEAPNGDLYGRKNQSWIIISGQRGVVINGNRFGLSKHPSNTNIETMEVNDMVLNGFWSTTVFWKQARYIGGDIDLIGSYQILDSIEEIPIT